MTTCMPFLRVPDVEKAKTWYEDLGFSCLGTHAEPGCGLDWALMDLDGARFMIYPDGREKVKERKDGGLYFSMNSIDGWSTKLRGKAEIIDETNATEYGRKEVVFLDLYGFQVTVSSDAEES